MSLVVQVLADAIQKKEGWFPGSRSFRNNNPGNIWDGIGKGKTARIWPDTPIDDKGFLVFATYAAGRALLERQIQINVDRGATLAALIARWAPPSENDTAKYIADVSKWTGIPADAVLSRYQDGPAPGGSSPPVFSPGPGAVATLPGQPLPRSPKPKGAKGGSLRRRSGPGF